MNFVKEYNVFLLTRQNFAQEAKFCLIGKYMFLNNQPGDYLEIWNSKKPQAFLSSPQISEKLANSIQRYKMSNAQKKLLFTAHPS